jgi:phosphomannomutase
VIFLYEEALGYCIGDGCDKDGISAASVFLEMAGVLQREQGLTVKQHLQNLYLTFGEFVSYNSYVVSHDKGVTQLLFSQLRTAGPTGSYWTECAGSKILAIKDITVGYDSTTPDKKSPLPVTPESEMIMFEFDNGVSVTLRTSGTEPKIKYYTEIAGRPGEARALAESVLHTFVDKLVDEMLHPEQYGLARA